jgi:hypothetical protein
MLNVAFVPSKIGLAALCVIVRSADAVTVTAAVSGPLLVVFGSDVDDVTVASFVTLPVASGRTVSVIVSLCAPASVANVQTTGPVPVHVPPVAVALTNSPFVNAFVTETLVAEEGPLFVTVTLKVAFVPSKIGLAALCVTARSADAATATDAVSGPLLAVFGSNVVLVTFAVLVVVPADEGCTVSVTVAL